MKYFIERQETGGERAWTPGDYIKYLQSHEGVTIESFAKYLLLHPPLPGPVGQALAELRESVSTLKHNLHLPLQIPQGAVFYQEESVAGPRRVMSCEKCAHFYRQELGGTEASGAACRLVKGPIAPWGWCPLFIPDGVKQPLRTFLAAVLSRTPEGPR